MAFVFVARLLRQSFRSWLRIVPWLLVPALLLALPTIPFDFDDFKAQWTATTPLLEPRHPWTLFVRLLSALILQGAAAQILFTRQEGEPLAVGALLRSLGRRLLPLAATALLVIAIVVAALLPGALFGSVWPDALVLLALGLLPVIFFSLATSVVAVERTAPLVALRRSLALTHGVRSVVCVALVAAFLAGTLVLIGLTELADAIAPAPVVQFNIVFAGVLATDTFNAVLVAHLYGALRVMKEGGQAATSPSERGRAKPGAGRSSTMDDDEGQADPT